MNLPDSIEVDGHTHDELGMAYSEHLKFYVTLDIKELRERQDLTRQQQGLLFDIGERTGVYNRRAYHSLQAAEHLLTQAVGFITFPDWG